ncbi:MAG: mannosyltransferase family protein [Candidatus Tyrphobacter sp.]
MSADIHSRSSHARSLDLGEIYAGRLPALVVLLSGATLGFFFWYGAIVPAHGAALSELGLLVAVPAGALLAYVAWRVYGRYFSRRAGIKLAHSLRYDAITWVPFFALWLSFVLTPYVASSSRLFAAAIALFCIGKVLIGARFNQTVREVLIDFLVSRAAIIIIAELAAVIIGQRPGTHVQESRHALLAVWGRWDAVHYLGIAAQGYHGIEAAFFPLYPLLIHILGVFTGNDLIAGLLISNAAFFFGLLYLYKLLEHEFDRVVARRAIFYVSIFPTAIYFSAVYTESLFFFLTVASFYYMRSQRWWIAGVLGFFAALTRAEGLLLAIPFAIEWFARYHSEPLRGLRDAAAGLLIPIGLGLYMAYLWVLRGDALYFSHVQAHWGRQAAPPWVSVMNSFHGMLHATAGQTVANQALELSFTALMLFVLIGGWRRLRLSYTAYMALSVLAPMCTASLMSMPRFGLVLFPMFAILAQWGERPWANNLIVAFSLPLLGLFTVLFANWYWVA